MGYYSDVKLSTTKEGWGKITEHVRKVSGGDHLLMTATLVLHGAGKYVVVSFEDIKWYENDEYYPSVRAFMEGLTLLEQSKIPYQYVRVGEDTGDVDRYDSGVMLDGMRQLYVSTVIEEY